MSDHKIHALWAAVIALAIVLLFLGAVLSMDANTERVRACETKAAPNVAPKCLGQR